MDLQAKVCYFLLFFVFHCFLVRILTQFFMNITYTAVEEVCWSMYAADSCRAFIASA